MISRHGPIRALRRGAWAAAALFAFAATVAEGGARVADAAVPTGPVVAAASDLQFALPELADRFTADTGLRVRLAFGSSGNFARQIRQGAPFELFLSADESYVLALADDGFTRDRGDLYAIGRIALFVPDGSPLVADGSLADLRDALADGRLRKFAIANPDHAPYGRAAAEALRRAGLWAAIESHLVLGENVSQAAQFAASGSTEGGIIAYSLALSPKLAAQGRFALVPAAWHRPLRQRMVLLRRAGDTATRFRDYIRQPAARSILRKYGFALPGEGG